MWGGTETAGSGHVGKSGEDQGAVVMRERREGVSMLPTIWRRTLLLS